MTLRQYVGVILATILIASLSLGQDGSTSGVKGKVRVENGSASGINVLVKQGDREVAHVTTDSKGAFHINGLTPGNYTIVFSKLGFSTGTLSKVELRAGKVRELSDKLILTVDEGSLAFLRGSVFDPIGHSVSGARVELLRVGADGVEKKLDGRLTNESGQFVFRLTPEAATYRVRVKMDGAEPVSKDVEIDGAAVYRVALSLKPAAR